MTVEEFDNTDFFSGIKIKYKENIYDIISVDFEENLIAIDEIGDMDDLCWKRCENCEIHIP